MRKHLRTRANIIVNGMPNDRNSVSTKEESYKWEHIRWDSVSPETANLYEHLVRTIENLHNDHPDAVF